MPPRPSGTSREAIFDQSTWDKTHGPEGRIKSSSSVKVSRTTAGIGLKAVGGKSPTFVLYFRSMGWDYIICGRQPGNLPGDTDIKVAKPYKLRFSIESAVIDGGTVIYSGWDTDAQTRHASGADEEDQVITERYLVDDPIWVEACRTLAQDDDENDIPIMDTNRDARAWMKV